MVDSALVTAQELAKELNLSVDTIWRYTRERKIPCVELGGRQYRYRLSQVVKALSTVTESSPQDQSGPQTKLTYEDYLALPEEPGYRFEVLDGLLVREPSANVPHQRVSRRLQRILEDYFWSMDPSGEVFNAPLDLTLGKYSVVQPDLFYMSGQQKELVQHTRVDGAPTLAVEVLHPSTGRKDRLLKMRIYQQAGILHYWIVDPENKTLECYQLSDGIYGLITNGIDHEDVIHPALTGLVVPLSRLW